MTEPTEPAPADPNEFVGFAPSSPETAQQPIAGSEPGPGRARFTGEVRNVRRWTEDAYVYTQMRHTIQVFAFNLDHFEPGGRRRSVYVEVRGRRLQGMPQENEVVTVTGRWVGEGRIQAESIDSWQNQRDPDATAPAGPAPLMSKRGKRLVLLVSGGMVALVVLAGCVLGGVIGYGPLKGISPFNNDPVQSAGCRDGQPGPWKVTGSKVTVTIGDLGWNGKVLVAPTTLRNDGGNDANLDVQAFDDANRALDIEDGFNGGAVAKRSVTSELKVKITPERPPASVTFGFKDFFWTDRQRLTCTVTLSAVLRQSITKGAPTSGGPSTAPALVVTGPWRAQGSGTTVTVESVSRAGAKLTIPVVVSATTDIQNFQLSVFDQAGNPVPEVPFESRWERIPQGGTPVRNVVVLDSGAHLTPTSLKLTFKGFFWQDNQRLSITVPVPR